MGFRTSSVPGDAVVANDLSTWFRCRPGCLLTRQEQQLLAGILPDLFGYHIVQLGCHHLDDLVASSRISHQLRVELGARAGQNADLYCAEDALPLAANAIDVLVLPHVIEFADDARRVLREAERVLIGEGHIVLLAFNPWSVFGLWSLLRRWQGHAPWSAHLIGIARVKDWLQVLGFDIVLVARAGYRPPLSHKGMNRRLEFLEKLGAFCWPALGNVYLVVGKKRVEGITPLKASWRQRRRSLSGSVAEPSARHGVSRRSDRHEA